MICKVSTNDNVADPLTEALAQEKDDHHANSWVLDTYMIWLNG